MQILEQVQEIKSFKLKPDTTFCNVALRRKLIRKYMDEKLIMEQTTLESPQYLTSGDCSAEMNIEHKTILLMGVTASVKSALINEMANYILCVNLEDPFRFHIGVKTEFVAANEFHYTKGFCIPFSMTIFDIHCLIDINGLCIDKELKEMMSSFFNLEYGIQVVDMVGLVAQSHGLQEIMQNFEYYLLSV